MERGGKKIEEEEEKKAVNRGTFPNLRRSSPFPSEFRLTKNEILSKIFHLSRFSPSAPLFLLPLLSTVWLLFFLLLEFDGLTQSVLSANWGGSELSKGSHDYNFLPTIVFLV